MSDRLNFDSVRRVLEEITPTDTWDEARQRAAHASLVPLDAAGSAGRAPRAPARRSRAMWFASIAACLLAIVAVAAAVMADHEGVDTIDPAEVPTTSPDPVLVERYGRVVSEHSVGIQEWIDREEASDHVEDSFPQYVRERYDELRPLLKEFEQALAELPAPPDEIATLVLTTEGQVTNALQSVDLLLSCPEPSRSGCPDEYWEAEAAYRALPVLFASWRPYT